MAAHSYYIPTTSSRVNVAQIHPELARRVSELCKLLPGLKVVSGARSFESQKYLYDGYKAGKKGFNLAASPTRVWNGGKGPGRGSRHQIQEPYGVAFAVDVRRYSYSWARIHSLLPSLGLVANVPGEAWHLTCNERGSLTKFLPAPRLDAYEVPPAPELNLNIVGKLIEHATSRVLRYGNRGVSVTLLQSQMILLGWLPAGEADGIFGRKTLNAVRRLQKAAHLAPDGLVGKKTWNAVLFERPEAPLKLTEGAKLVRELRDRP